MDSGDCPDTHPTRMISLFMETIWDTNPYKDQWRNGKSPFVFSTGDPLVRSPQLELILKTITHRTGYSYHSGFVNVSPFHTRCGLLINSINRAGMSTFCRRPSTSAPTTRVLLKIAMCSLSAQIKR